MIQNDCTGNNMLQTLNSLQNKRIKVSVVSIVSVSPALGLHLIFLLLMSHEPGPCRHHSSRGLVVFETSEEVVLN